MNEDKFWARVEKRGPDECWPWQGEIRPTTGYGRVGLGGRRTGAHRMAYELTFGPIPESLFIDHTCHNADKSCPGGPGCPHRRCVNPGHLEAVPSPVNTARGQTGIHQRSRTHCPHGHALTPDNLVAHSGKGRPVRRCKLCRKRQGKAWRSP